MTRRSGDGTTAQSSRERRLSEALKANLNRRKMQQRQRAARAESGLEGSAASGPRGDEDRGKGTVVAITDNEESS